MGWSFSEIEELEGFLVGNGEPEGTSGYVIVGQLQLVGYVKFAAMSLELRKEFSVEID